MKIIAGRWRGRALAAPTGFETRPTAARAREAVFNILAHGEPGATLEGAPVLDVFAGAGAMGLEALSRGAARAVFIDKGAEALRAVRGNADALDCAHEIETFKLDAAKLAAPPVKAGAPFGLVFMDAPYGQGLTGPALAGLAAHGWLAAGAVIAAETGAREAFTPPPGFIQRDERRFGAAKIVFMRWET
ncbi:MAG: 16S rRNA (guanine(966)-N(2))-methyltransferase RsmD [Rhodospirillales bacterium]